MFNNNNTLKYDRTTSCDDTSASRKVSDIYRQYPVHLFEHISAVLCNTLRQIRDRLILYVYFFLCLFYKWYV